MKRSPKPPGTGNSDLVNLYIAMGFIAEYNHKLTSHPCRMADIRKEAGYDRKRVT